jgi:predicted type IV restriction endonuclease
MGNIPKKAEERIVAGLRRLQPVIQSAKDRDIHEADTVTIIKDMLQEIFGYDKYTEVSSEHLIRGTYCDLAVQVDGKVQLLIEVKAVGVDLKDAQVKQAIDYAANKGVDWVALTNGHSWQVYKMDFSQPIDKELVLNLDILQLSSRSDEHIEQLYLLTREGRSKSALDEYQVQRQAMSRYSLAAIALSEPVLAMMRRELKRLSPSVRIEASDISAVLANEVFKREVVEGEKAEAARKKVSRALKKQERAKQQEKGADASAAVAVAPTSQGAEIRKL